MAGDSSGKVTGKRKRKVGLLYDERMCKRLTVRIIQIVLIASNFKVIWEKLQLTGLAQRFLFFLSSFSFGLAVNVWFLVVAKRKMRISQFHSIYLNGSSSEAAYLSAGSVVEVAEKVAKGELDRGFTIVRPPGHHAEEDEAMGFCLFNNVAVAASYLLNERPELGIRRILIADWDVHHGNGTQKMFWKDPHVLVFSAHRHGGGSFYPTGDDGDYDKVGEGPGEGKMYADYLAVWDHILIPVTKEFKPDIILLSAGFDAATGDPLGSCLVTPYGYSVMLKKLMEFAQGKIVMALEGGYNLHCGRRKLLLLLQLSKPLFLSIIAIFIAS
ncbi:hypothetical protein Bca52824_034220 [Brassica carinata]|uniref:Histone deacetylase domain-containing protein n=1 Tax=Brassica carinata TaxID=52824 RepID=A0A8X7SEA3_BRACI|nr:hypothetical protein Bca52824_034220 [Brassica carinata]